MKLSRIGRIGMAFVVSVAIGLGMTACGGGTIGYMWVLGTQYNQIAGFKIDDYTGNLTQMVGSPYPSGGTFPVALALKPGGRFLYVVNKGAGSAAGNISEFSVGGDGVLTFQAAFSSQGSTPVWAVMDSAGSFLVCAGPVWLRRRPICPVVWDVACGDITVFSIAAVIRAVCRWCPEMRRYMNPKTERS